MNTVACYSETDFGCAACLCSAHAGKIGELIFFSHIMGMSSSCRENILMSSLMFLLGVLSELPAINTGSEWTCLSRRERAAWWASG